MTVVRLSGWTGCRLPCTGIYITRLPIALWYSSQVKTLDCICTKCSLYTLLYILLPTLNFIHNNYISSIRMHTDSPPTLCPVYLPALPQSPLPPPPPPHPQLTLVFHPLSQSLFSVCWDKEHVQKWQHGAKVQLNSNTSVYSFPNQHVSLTQTQH